MNVSVTDVSPSQKKLRVEIPAARVRDEFDEKYRDLAKKVKIKGFRPGKVPQSIIKSYYGKAVEHELSSEFIQKTFPEALKETDLKPLTQADVSDSNFEESGCFSYTAMIDICPPFELPQYKGLDLYKPPVVVADDQVQAELDKLREGHAQLRAVEEDRPIAQSDVVIVDFTPSVDGKVFEKGTTHDYMIEIGKASLHPDFDKNLIGHKPGEDIAFDLVYPDNAPSPEIAGKTVHFQVAVKELKVKEVPELNDEFAQSLGSAQFDSLDALKQEIRNGITKREEDRISAVLHERITEKLLQQVQFELSPRVVDREADRMAENLKYQFESQGIPFDAARFNTPEMKAGYRLQAEKNIRVRLTLEKIAECEQISLDDDDSEEIYRQIGKAYHVDPEKVKHEYGDSVIIEQARDRKLEDKVMKFIESEAVYLDKPEEPAEPESAEQAEQPVSGETEQE